MCRITSSNTLVGILAIIALSLILASTAVATTHNSLHSVILAGTTVPPATLSPATLGFGNQLGGTTSAAKTATLKNAQTVPLTISSIAISGGTAPADYARGGTVQSVPRRLVPARAAVLP